MMQGLSGMFSMPLTSWRTLQVTRNHQIMLRAQPEISWLRKMGLTGQASKAMSVKMGAVISWPIKNKLERRKSMGLS
jgi:hypothetical protein